MKKRLVILAGSLIAAALSVVIFAHKPMSAEQALLLRNVEALAQSEGGNGGGSTCTVIGNHSVWSGGCKYYCNVCAEGYYVALYIEYCIAR